MPEQIKIGDRVQFRTRTLHSGTTYGTRKVVAIMGHRDGTNSIGVRLYGWDPYWLTPDEIQAVKPAEKKAKKVLK